MSQNNLAKTLTEICAFYLNFQKRSSIFRMFRDREEWLEWHQGGIERYGYDAQFRANVDLLVERLMDAILNDWPMMTTEHGGGGNGRHTLK